MWVLSGSPAVPLLGVSVTAGNTVLSTLQCAVSIATRPVLHPRTRDVTAQIQRIEYKLNKTLKHDYIFKTIVRALSGVYNAAAACVCVEIMRRCKKETTHK